jgi:hypothetical protein
MTAIIGSADFAFFYDGRARVLAHAATPTRRTS